MFKVKLYVVVHFIYQGEYVEDKDIMIKHGKINCYKELIMSFIALAGLILAIQGQYISLIENKDNAIKVLQQDTQDIIERYYDYRRELINSKTELNLDIAKKLKSRKSYSDYFRDEYNRIKNQKLEEIKNLENMKNDLLVASSFLYIFYLVLLYIKYKYFRELDKNI